MPPCKFVTADIISVKDSVLLSTQDVILTEIAENDSEFDVKQEQLSRASPNNLETIETLSSKTELSTVSGHEAFNRAQFAYGNEFSKSYSQKLLLDRFKDEIIEHQNEIPRRDSIRKSSGSIKSISQTDHVYEEVTALKETPLFEYDILDYYEKYSPTTAKTLINTLFLPRHKICKQCANLQDSPVYTDSLIYAKKQLFAREVDLCQQNDALHFKYFAEDGKPSTALFSQYDNNQPCMLVYNYVKTSASGIFYFHGPPRDVFDLKMVLKPNILLFSSAQRGFVNTQVYHRYVNNFYTRISNSGNAPMTFHVNHNNILTSIKHVGYDTDLQNWMTYRSDVFQSRCLKQDDVPDHRANRSSLLLLEPLLLMPDLASPRYRHGKNRISHSEHMKIVRIVIAYTLSFFILTIITFYIVYFT